MWADSVATPQVGGWAHIGFLNMSDPTHHCPPAWREITSPVRTCGFRHLTGSIQTHRPGCNSVVLSTHGMKYAKGLQVISMPQFQDFWEGNFKVPSPLYETLRPALSQGDAAHKYLCTCRVDLLETQSFPYRWEHTVLPKNNSSPTCIRLSTLWPVTWSLGMGPAPTWLQNPRSRSDLTGRKNSRGMTISMR